MWKYEQNHERLQTSLNESISQVPETPIWLISRGRTEEAERSLCWLRGWVTRDVVEEEFNELMKYSDTTKRKKSVTIPMIQFATTVSVPFQTSQH